MQSYKLDERGLPVYEPDLTLSKQERKAAHGAYRKEYLKQYQRLRCKQGLRAKPDPAKSREWNQRYRERHPDRIAEIRKRNYQRNRDARLALARDYYNAHRASILEKRRLLYSSKKTRKNLDTSGAIAPQHPPVGTGIVKRGVIRKAFRLNGKNIRTRQ